MKKLKNALSKKSVQVFAAIVTVLFSTPVFASGNGLESVSTALTKASDDVKKEATKVIAVAVGLVAMFWGVKKLVKFFKGIA